MGLRHWTYIFIYLYINSVTNSLKYSRIAKQTCRIFMRISVHEYKYKYACTYIPNYEKSVYLYIYVLSDTHHVHRHTFVQMYIWHMVIFIEIP